MRDINSITLGEIKAELENLVKLSLLYGNKEDKELALERWKAFWELELVARVMFGIEEEQEDGREPKKDS